MSGQAAFTKFQRNRFCVLALFCATSHLLVWSTSHLVCHPFHHSSETVTQVIDPGLSSRCRRRVTFSSFGMQLRRHAMFLEKTSVVITQSLKRYFEWGVMWVKSKMSLVILRVRVPFKVWEKLQYHSELLGAVLYLFQHFLFNIGDRLCSKSVFLY